MLACIFSFRAEGTCSSVGGTSLAEAVRIFAKQSVLENGMPFVISANQGNTYGRLSKYANPKKQELEKGAYEKAMVEKHEEAD